jgi:excisionase family DNA binding protein
MPATLSKRFDLEQISPWIGAREAARRALVSTRTIYAEVRAGRLRAARVGGRRDLRFRAAWIDEWLDASAPQEIQR